MIVNRRRRASIGRKSSHKPHLESVASYYFYSIFRLKFFWGFQISRSCARPCPCPCSVLGCQKFNWVRTPVIAFRWGAPTRSGWVATRMSPAAAYGRLLHLDFATPPNPSSSAINSGLLQRLKRHAACRIRSAWHSAQRHQGGADGPTSARGTAAELSGTPT